VNIALLTGNGLCHNPRVIKEARALARAGHEVEVLGAWSDPALKARDMEMLSRLPFRFTPVIDRTDPSIGGGLRRGGRRIRKSLGHLAHRIAHFQNRWELGDSVTALASAARSRSADLYIAHSEPGMAAACDLMSSGRRVGVDMEDWFSEDLLPEARAHRPVSLLRDMERTLLCGGAYSSCTSIAMSNALASDYGCAPPAVIYNAFPWADRDGCSGELQDRKDRRVPSIHWYSQTLGHGRGLEDLFAALPYVRHDVEVHLRGHPVAGFDDWLRERVPGSWKSRVFVHALVPNGQLLARISEHDIGFAGEMKYCRNKDLTISNKAMHYLLAGLAVVASDTLGQRELAERAPGAVFLYASGDAATLAGRIDSLLGRANVLGDAKAAALRAAEQALCWERQEPVLLDTIRRALVSNRA
jgi:hypothetical protein